MKTPTLLMAAVAAVNLRAAVPLPTEFPISRGDLQTRDPFVVVDRANGRYCLFRTYYVEPGDPAGDYFGMTGRGVQVSESTDLEHWSEAKPVLEIPEEFDCKAVWAPEVHSYKGKWYIFTTLNYRTEGRGTWTFVSDDLRGPYRPMAKRSVTPVDWWCLDGTLWVEDGKPYMVFCHEWQQIVDGEMCYVPLTDDLSAADGEPVTIFKASDGPHVRPDCLVTDGPFLERTADGGLEMIWSSHLDTGAYCVFKVRSESGKLAGPWKRHETIFDADGGHAMLFTDLQGRRRIALHSPNKPGTERPFFLPYDGTTKRELKSPDGRNSIVFTVGETLAYQIFRDGKAMTEPAEVALELEGGPTLGERPKLLDTVRTEREEKIATPIYKKSEITGVTRFMTLSFADGWSVEAAARDDGVAFRHVTSRGGKMVVKNERLPLRFASRDQQVIACADWACYDPDDRFQNSWEGVYHQLPLSEAPTNTSEAIWYTPVTFLSDGAAMCVTESDLRDYPGWCLVGGGDGRSLEGIFAGYPTKLECVGGEGGDTRGIGERVLARAGHIAETDGTRAFPWRVFMLASEPADLIASDIVMALAEPASGDFSWVKPGKVAWEWWNDWNVSGVDFKAGINTKTYEKYIDFAAEYGLEYVILDLGWSVGYDVMRIAPGMDVAELIRYGKARGVGIILWSTASQFIGRIGEVMDTYKAMGAAGFKVDYMDRNDQLMVAWLEEIARHAAERRLVVDFHGMYKPTGLQRKYPNILNFEGVHGLEQMKWEKETTQPVHDCLMAYTRLAAGPLDYTPGAMRNCRREGWAPVHGRPGSLGTRCHQLGLAVILEAPLQMLCDSPTQYRKNAECARFLAEVPTVWDEIRPLGGVPGKSVVLARRKGDVWYVGAIGAWDEQTVEIDTSFLAAGEWRLTAFADGVNADRDPEDYARTVRVVRAGEKPVYTLGPGGGLALKIEPMQGDVFASGRARASKNGTEMDGILFHNVRNFWETPEGGFAMLRASAQVDAVFDDFGKLMSASGSGVELRFLMTGDEVEVELGCESADGVAACTLYYGDFVADWPETDKLVRGRRSSVRIRRSPHAAKLREIHAREGGRFDPDVVRLVLPGDRLRYFGVKGGVAVPREDQLPQKTYLAYGSSITHGSIPLHVLHAYVERVAAGLDAEGRLRLFRELSSAKAACENPRRLSTVMMSVDEPAVEAAAHTTFGDQLQFAWTVGANASDNPFRHAWHPDHDGKTADYSGPVVSGDDLANYANPVKPELWSVTNTLYLSWHKRNNPTEDADFEHNPEETPAGYATWTVGGLLSNGPIKSMGVFFLKRIADVGTVEE